jgi:LytS/YehU family sensor histidine kinase
VVAGVLGGGLAWAALAASAAEAIDPFEQPAPFFGPSGTSTPRPPRLVYVAALAVWSGLYLALRTWQRQRTQARRLLEADAAASTARLQMLRYQLNPHFFFNALNTISALADEEPARVKTVVSRLSGFLRYTLLDADALVVPLGEEVAAARRYLDVEQIRFEDDLEVQVDVPPAAATRRVPAFVLLPLVENAVKHGLRTSPVPLRVRLTARLDEAEDDGAEGGASSGAAGAGASEAATLVLTVANTGTLRADDAGADAAPGTGTGLANVRARLAAHYPARHRVTLTETADGWVRARLTLTGAPDVG